MFQFEQRLEPFVEWFHGRSPQSIKAASFGCFQKCLALFSALMITALAITPNSTLARFFRRGISGILRTKKTSARTAAVLFPFNCISVGITVVTAVGQNVKRFAGQMVDFFSKAGVFAGACGVCRSQQRPQRPIRIGSYHDFEAVALYPTMVIGVTPTFWLSSGFTPAAVVGSSIN